MNIFLGILIFKYVLSRAGKRRGMLAHIGWNLTSGCVYSIYTA